MRDPGARRTPASGPAGQARDPRLCRVEALSWFLDNSIRILRPVPTAWVLCDIQIHGVHDGFAHGQIHLWSETGVLMATGGQSAIVRLFGNPPA